MEAKIEVLTTELESQKKQNQRDNDSLKIKTKIVDDQTETIRKLKEVNTLGAVKKFNMTCLLLCSVFVNCINLLLPC